MAPHPDLLHPLAKEWLEEMPWPIANDPDIRAAVHCQCKEAERAGQVLEELRAEFNPLTASERGLSWWSVLLHMPVEEGVTLETLRANVLARLRALPQRPRGLDQEEAFDALLGAGTYTYEEHVAGDLTSPPEGTVRFTVSQAPPYDALRRDLSQILEPHIDVIVQSSGGFVLDQSQLDQEGLA